MHRLKRLLIFGMIASSLVFSAPIPRKIVVPLYVPVSSPKLLQFTIHNPSSVSQHVKVTVSTSGSEVFVAKAKNIAQSAPFDSDINCSQAYLVNDVAPFSPVPNQKQCTSGQVEILSGTGKSFFLMLLVNPANASKGSTSESSAMLEVEVNDTQGYVVGTGRLQSDLSVATDPITLSFAGGHPF